jgi:hypothetical protein
LQRNFRAQIWQRHVNFANNSFARGRKDKAKVRTLYRGSLNHFGAEDKYFYRGFLLPVRESKAEHNDAGNQ